MFVLMNTFAIRSAAESDVIRTFKNKVVPLLEKAPGFIKADLFTRSRLNKGVALLYWDTERAAGEYTEEGSLKEALSLLAPFLIGEYATEGYEPNLIG